jgi:coenzyme PQQ precursor peptide PqqA
MNETMEQTKAAEQAPPTETAPAGWQTPGYEAVDTALEVTAYSLNSR